MGRLTAVLNELGWILASHPYSNIALAIDFEMSAQGPSRLRSALAALPLALSDASLEALARLENTPVPELPDGIAGSLHITFVHSEPDLHLEIPAVPG